MSSKKRKYSLETKLEAVRLFYEDGLSRREIAERLELPSMGRVKTLVRLYRREGPSGLKKARRGRPPKYEDREAYIKRLEMENALLKKFHTELRKEIDSIGNNIISSRKRIRRIKMLTHETIKNKEKLFLDMTSLRPAEFEKLLLSFEKAWNNYQENQGSKGSGKRKRKKGGGRKGSIKKTADKLLFILVYFKIYPLQVVQGQLFGMSQPQANYWIGVLSPILQKALAYERQLPSRSPQNLVEVLSKYDTLNFQIDGTERRRQRPKDRTKQKEFYSGKKKHTPTKTMP